jgi:hypothetical protein
MRLNNQRTWDLLAKIQEANNDVVFVGGMAEMMQGKRKFTSDIDICVLNTDGLDIFGEIKEWETTSPVSISGKRAGIENDEVILDIFIENELPETVEISGLRFETLESLKTRYERVISEIDPKQSAFKAILIENLRNLTEE